MQAGTWQRYGLPWKRRVVDFLSRKAEEQWWEELVALASRKGTDELLCSDQRAKAVIFRRTDKDNEDQKVLSGSRALLRVLDETRGQQDSSRVQVQRA